MKTTKTRILSLLLSFGTIAGCSAAVDDGTGTSKESQSLGTFGGGDFGAITTSTNTVDAPFVVRGLAHKCIDVGGEAYQAVGAPVILYGCNGTVAQTLRVVEFTDGTHDVSLRTGKGFCLGVRDGVAAGHALELQTCAPVSPRQRFALDGDTIFVGTQTAGRVARDLVVEVQGGRAANRTPLVVGTRELDDSEDFRFAATTFAAPFPTSGFTLVVTRVDLDRALSTSHWGSVIEVTASSTLYIDDLVTRQLGEGVTLRGERKGMEDGPEINRRVLGTSSLFLVVGDHARITGLRLRGPSTSHDPSLPVATGIITDGQRSLTVDHDELSAWTESAVNAQGGSYYDTSCPAVAPPDRTIQVVRNYIHDNARSGLGYGVCSNNGANTFIHGNTFDHNRHSVASDGNGHTNYTATYNLVLRGNRYSDLTSSWREQDFDVHGSLGTGHNGGTAGGLFYMTNNTFYDLGKNIDLRGTPCFKLFIRDNVFVDQLADAIKSLNEEPARLQIADNTFSAAVGATTVGDFDGDGTLDDFMGTGAAWYYRPGRSKEWRFLNGGTEQVAQLSFGDFDGDGRADVRRKSPRDGVMETSWGGSSPWDRPLILAGGIGGGPLLP